MQHVVKAEDLNEVVEHLERLCGDLEPVGWLVGGVAQAEDLLALGLRVDGGVGEVEEGERLDVGVGAEGHGGGQREGRVDVGLDVEVVDLGEVDLVEEPGERVREVEEEGELERDQGGLEGRAGAGRRRQAAEDAGADEEAQHLPHEHVQEDGLELAERQAVHLRLEAEELGLLDDRPAQHVLLLERELQLEQEGAQCAEAAHVRALDRRVGAVELEEQVGGEEAGGGVGEDAERVEGVEVVQELVQVVGVDLGRDAEEGVVEGGEQPEGGEEHAGVEPEGGREGVQDEGEREVAQVGDGVVVGGDAVHEDQAQGG